MEALKAEVDKWAQHVRKLKASNADKAEVKAAVEKLCAAKAAVCAGNTRADPLMAALDDHLATRSYVGGYVGSKADLQVLGRVGNCDLSAYPHVARWRKHVQVTPYTVKDLWKGAEIESLPISSIFDAASPSSPAPSTSTSSTSTSSTSSAPPSSSPSAPSADNDERVQGKKSKSAVLKEKVDVQGDKIREMKAAGASKEDVLAEVTILKQLKADYAKQVKKAQAAMLERKQWRSGLEDLLKRKFFYIAGFEIYGGVAGLYDFGPTGCALKDNVLNLWRQHFVLEESMLQVDCSSLTPEIVLQTSGHVAKFCDFMVKDVVNEQCHRADKILEDHMDALIAEGVDAERKAELLAVRTQADAYSQDELHEVLTKYGVKAPDTGNDITEPFPFNLMFATQIGPTGKFQGYLRPETAQGIFVNFRRLLEYNGGRMPFAAAQIGLAFRNEISPRSGLIRVREFCLAEIEHFVDPDNKLHPKFGDVRDYQFLLLDRADQTGEDKARIRVVGEAVDDGTINNETLAYFMARTHMFLVKCGIDPNRLRFRQHKATEMAHYAADCWDAEIHTSYGWVECVGHADRAAFDLKVHTAASKVELVAQERFDTPVINQVAKINYNSGMIGKTFRKDSKTLTAHIDALSNEERMELNAQLDTESVTINVDGKDFELTREMLSVEMTEEKISTRKYTPSVVEPSFGIGRILYGILEHAYTVREKNGDSVAMLALSPHIAPVKCGVLPLASSPEVQTMVQRLVDSFVRVGVSTKLDETGASIGRKYARCDEIGVPFCITLDFESTKDQAVTVRERDSTAQVRVPVDKVVRLVFDLCNGGTSWEETQKNFAVVE